MYKIFFWILAPLIAGAFIFIGVSMLTGSADDFLLSFTEPMGVYGTMGAAILIIAGGIGLLLPGFSNGSGSLLSLLVIILIIAAILLEEYPIIIPASIALVLLQVLLNIRPKAFPKAADKIEELVDNVEERIEDFFEEDGDENNALS